MYDVPDEVFHQEPVVVQRFDAASVFDQSLYPIQMELNTSSWTGPKLIVFISVLRMRWQSSERHIPQTPPRRLPQVWYHL